jgi:hypothetical protein
MTTIKSNNSSVPIKRRYLNWRSLDTAVRSTFAWVIVVFASFIVMAFAVILVSGFGIDSLVAMQVGSQFWGFASLVWTVAVFFLRHRVTSRFDRPLVAFPPPPIGERDKFAHRHALARSTQPSTIVAAWLCGGFLIGSALITPLFVDANGGDPPIFLNVLSRGLLYLALGLFLLAVCLGPWMYRRGRVEYEAAYESAGGIEAAALSEKLRALAERARDAEQVVTELAEAQRLLRQELGKDKAKQAELIVKIESLEKMKDANVRGLEAEMGGIIQKARTPLTVDIIIAVGSAVLGYVASVFLPPEIFK